jgi:hypothetical protein
LKVPWSFIAVVFGSLLMSVEEYGRDLVERRGMGSALLIFTVFIVVIAGGLAFYVVIQPGISTSTAVYP